MADLTDADDPAFCQRLGEIARRVLAVDGAGVMLKSGGLAHGSLCTTNQVSALIEELQYTLSEGPGMDAYQQNQMVGEADLACPATARWLGFSPLALQGGVRAVFGYPLRVGTLCLGALDLYTACPGPLRAEQHLYAMVVADVLGTWMLGGHHADAARTVATWIDAGADFHLAVHNAAGMVSAQMGVDVAEALLRLRAYAFGHSQMLTTVADDVVARRLCFR